MRGHPLADTPREPLSRRNHLQTVEGNQLSVAADEIGGQLIVPDKTIDCIGLFCPMPIVKTKEALRPMAVGQVLEMLSDDPRAGRSERVTNSLKSPRMERSIVSSSERSGRTDR